jgi:hypothetical protein
MTHTLQVVQSPKESQTLTTEQKMLLFSFNPTSKATLLAKRLKKSLDLKHKSANNLSLKMEYNKLVLMLRKLSLLRDL